jgi:hypothetical protein
MVKVPAPEEEDRRRLCRERKLLITERVKHANRIKGLLFAQGYPDTSLCTATDGRAWKVQTGDGRLLPEHLKAQVRRELVQNPTSLSPITLRIRPRYRCHLDFRSNFATFGRHLPVSASCKNGWGCTTSACVLGGARTWIVSPLC